MKLHKGAVWASVGIAFLWILKVVMLFGIIYYIGTCTIGMVNNIQEEDSSIVKDIGKFTGKVIDDFKEGMEESGEETH